MSSVWFVVVLQVFNYKSCLCASFEPFIWWLERQFSCGWKQLGWNYSTHLSSVSYWNIYEMHQVRVYGQRRVALNWFRSYLTNRHQYVTFNNKISERRLLDCSVSRCSILDSLLFLIFINDFPNSSIFLSSPCLLTIAHCLIDLNILQPHQFQPFWDISLQAFSIGFLPVSLN